MRASPPPDATMIRAPFGHAPCLLFGIFAAPLGWVVQVAASFALAATSCFSRGVAKVGGLVTGASHAAIAVIMTLTIVLALVGLLVALRESRNVHRAPMDPRYVARSRSLAHVGVLSSSLFLAALAYSIVMFALSPHCPG